MHIDALCRINYPEDSIIWSQPAGPAQARRSVPHRKSSQQACSHSAQRRPRRASPTPLQWTRATTRRTTCFRATPGPALDTACPCPAATAARTCGRGALG